jgi:sugar lactone lactonase YvrE
MYKALIHSVLFIVQFNGQSTAGPVNDKAEYYLDSSKSSFGGAIEGAAVDQQGRLYAVNYQSATNKLASVSHDSRLLYEDPDPKSYLNGIRFVPNRFPGEPNAIALTVDVTNHKVLKLIKKGNKATGKVFCQDASMAQPNDLTLSRTGRIYLSGQKWQDTNQLGDGDIWMCTPDGKATLLDNKLYRTNGIELSPDETVLYVSEAQNTDGKVVSNKIWAYQVAKDTGVLGSKTLFVDFGQLDNTASIDVDGMRTDVDGNLFVTRNGGQQVVKFNRQGQPIVVIDAVIKSPTNLELAGVDGKTLFIVGRCPDKEELGCVTAWRNDVPGRAWKMLQAQ